MYAFSPNCSSFSVCLYEIVQHTDIYGKLMEFAICCHCETCLTRIFIPTPTRTHVHSHRFIPRSRLSLSKIVCKIINKFTHFLQFKKYITNILFAICTSLVEFRQIDDRIINLHAFSISRRNFICQYRIPLMELIQ